MLARVVFFTESSRSDAQLPQDTPTDAPDSQGQQEKTKAELSKLGEALQLWFPWHLFTEKIQNKYPNSSTHLNFL